MPKTVKVPHKNGFSLTLVSVGSNPIEDWDYYLLAENPSITWEVVSTNPGIGWNYGCLSRNPNITSDIASGNKLA